MGFGMISPKSEVLFGLVSTIALAALAACSSSSKQEQAGRAGERDGSERAEKSRGAGQLGEPMTRQGSETVASEQQITVTRKTEFPTVERSEIRADINRMNERHFTAMGFPSDLSKRIVQFREDEGPFGSVDDLMRVPGMDPELLAQRRDKLGVAAREARG